jgi:hypothetical protein
MTAIARVAAIATARAIGVVVTAPAVVATIVSGVTLCAIATITPISPGLLMTSIRSDAAGEGSLASFLDVNACGVE